MNVYELIQLLSEYPADSEVGPFIEGERKVRKLMGVTREEPIRSWHGMDPVKVLLLIVDGDEEPKP